MHVVVRGIGWIALSVAVAVVPLSPDPEGTEMRHTYTTRAVWAITVVLLAMCIWFGLALA